MAFYDASVAKEAISENVEQYIFGRYAEAQRIGELVKSPIEFRFAVWAAFNLGLDVIPSEECCHSSRGYIIPQFRIGIYTVDFLVVEKRGPRTTKVVVECDGHEFHEKTKAQVAHDKKRDRYMQTQGYGVLRFSGHEIFKDTEQCVVDVDNFLYSKAMESWKNG